MSIIFYDHLVNKQEVLTIIDTSSDPENHKGKLRQLVDDIVHQGLVEFILQKLHPHHHDTFLSRVEQAPYDPEILSYLKDHVGPDIEDQLLVEAEKLVAAIKKDLQS